MEFNSAFKGLNNINPSVVSNSRIDVIRETLIVGIPVKIFPVIFAVPETVLPCPPYCKRHYAFHILMPYNTREIQKVKAKYI